MSEPVSANEQADLLWDQIPAGTPSSPWQSNEEGPVPRRAGLLSHSLMDGRSVRRED